MLYGSKKSMAQSLTHSIGRLISCLQPRMNVCSALMIAAGCCVASN